MKINQKGFGGVEAIMLFVIVGMVGGVGYYVYNANSSKPESVSQQTTTKAPAKEPQSAPEIKTAADLDTASATLDQSSGDSDVSEANAIEKDVNSL